MFFPFPSTQSEPFPKDYKLDIAIVDCSTVLAAHFLLAADESPRINSIVAFSSKDIAVLHKCDKVKKIVCPGPPGYDDWSTLVNQNCEKLDAIIILFDYADKHQFGRPTHYQGRDERSSHHKMHRQHRPPVYDIARSLNSRGARIVVWCLPKPLSSSERELDQSDLEVFEESGSLVFDDIILLNVGEGTVLDDEEGIIEGVSSDLPLFLNIKSYFYHHWALDWLFGVIYLSDVAQLGIHHMLTGKAFGGNYRTRERRFSVGDMRRLGRELSTGL